jgi:hypothetical protein
MSVMKMKVDGYRIKIVYTEQEKEVYLMKAYLKKIEDSLILQDIELTKNPDDKILVIDDLATATLVRRQLENFVNEVDAVELEPVYNFQTI